MAYEELIRKAKEYLAPESGEFESYYRKAAENLRADYNSSLAELKKQYGKDKNAAAAQSMQTLRNMNQYLAARGLSRSGEGVQEQLNANISLANTLSELADSNSRQMAELAKSRNSGLLALEEKRIDRKDANEKWLTERAFEVAKAENAKAERDEDIAREAQQIADERAYQDAVRREKYAYQTSTREAEQAFKQRSTAEAREYELMKIASQREYEDAVRKYERELEAEIRAEKAKTDAEKAAKDQEYKMEYYLRQQADKERLLDEEREYEERIKASDRKYNEAQKQAEREYSAAQKAKEQSDEKRRIAEERAYKEKLAEAERAEKEKQARQAQQDKLELYRLQQADKERLIAEERAYNESKKNGAGTTGDGKAEDDKRKDAASLSSSEKSYVNSTARSILSAATEGGKRFTTLKERGAAYELLSELEKQETGAEYVDAVRNSLIAAGYKEPTADERRVLSVAEGAEEAYNDAYRKTVDRLAEESINSIAAKPLAAGNAADAQLEYIFTHTGDTQAFYETCDILSISRDAAFRYLQKKNAAETSGGSGMKKAYQNILKD